MGRRSSARAHRRPATATPIGAATTDILPTAIMATMPRGAARRPRRPPGGWSHADADRVEAAVAPTLALGKLGRRRGAGDGQLLLVHLRGDAGKQRRGEIAL